MEDYQQRVVDEKTELDGKIERLNSFFSNPKFRELPPDEQDRMTRQCQAMIEYTGILAERIAAF